jgi:hypothetical protein
MATTKDSAPPAHPSTRFVRGIILAQERFEEIERVRPWIWRVPSCSGPGAHFVDLRHGDCSCPDHVPAGEECKHTSAARYVKARTATCSGCGERFRHVDLLEVTDPHHLTFFEGDALCRDCALHHGVL